MKPQLLLPAAAILLAAAGCATQHDVQYARDDIQQTRASVADMRASMTALQSEMAQLRGQIDDLQFRAGSGAEREEILQKLESLEARVSIIEEVGPVAAAPGLGAHDPQAALGAVTTGLTGLDLGPVPSDAPPVLREGLDLLRAGDGREAIQKFREFLRRSPRSPLADDVQYWIGEAYFSMGDYNRAILEFNEVLLRYPRADRVPRALLRQALAFAELGDRVDARLVLQKLVSEHGTTPEAEVARQKLLELGS